MVVGELNGDEDESGGGGDGENPMYDHTTLWIQPSVTGFYGSSIGGGSEGSGTKCHAQPEE